MILSPLPDQAQRDAAIRERTRNVVVDAGAGTGKTELLVRRFVEMVAPEHGGTPVPVERLAAITFTRRAAGELAFRIRQRVLSEIASASEPRLSHLRTALPELDGAAIGTIHSFCDRLLRLFPVEARLPAAYEVVEDPADLVRETLDLLHAGARDGSLGRILEVDSALADEAVDTLRDVPSCGLRFETVETPYGMDRFGLDALVEGFVRTRDVPPAVPSFPEFDPSTFRGYARELIGRVELLPDVEGEGVDLLREIAEALRRVEREEDPVTLFAEIARNLSRREPLRRAARRADLGNDGNAWETWQAIFGSTRRDPPRTPPLRDDLLAPLRAWLAARLARLQPVVVAAYERVKRQRRCLDPIDLLVKLRDVLRARVDIRLQAQEAFDHLLIDEFQDTDPLQAEILLYLAEDGASAADWKAVELRAGKLTLVGDPKQSIYRFRRADIAMYADVTRRLTEQGAVRFTLSANLRTDPALVEWLNGRFLDLLQAAPDGDTRFDPESGRAYHEPLTVGRRAAATTPRVHVLPIVPDGDAAEDFRRVEAIALSSYVRWLVESSGESVAVSATVRRPIRYGDIAILATVTTNLGMLVAPFDTQGIPYSISGGRLFLQDELHRRFILGLRALGDRDDGVAEAALLRPPFFALDSADVLRERNTRRAGREAVPAPAAIPDPLAERAASAVTLVNELRRRRHDRPPGATARDLLERTAIGRVTALGANGSQRLAGLREICVTLERVAARDRLDYDAASAVLRDWVESPAPLDPPPPTGADAVRILTVHQAKGLEFPVVVLWDCRGTMRPRNDTPTWTVSRDGSSWVLALDGLVWEQPRNAEIREHERRYEATQRERLTYVAATRVRDLLVVPCDGHPTIDRPGARSANRVLLGNPDDITIRLCEAFVEAAPPAWAHAPSEPGGDQPEPVADAGRVTLWSSQLAASSRPFLEPRAVSTLAWEIAGRVPPDEAWAEESRASLAEDARPASAPSRFGSRFGTTVHEAIRLAITSSLSPDEAVRRSSLRTGLDRHVVEAVADVERALEALIRERLLDGTAELQFEYPVAGPIGGDASLAVGSIDLLAAKTAEWVLLDFKTDAVHDVTTESSPYAEQVRLYASLLPVPSGTTLRVGLLFTEDGGIRWVKV